MRSSIRRTWRSVTFNRLAAATCVRCFCFTSCNTFNRSRSRWLKAMRSVSMGPSANHESGHFYFAQTGHSHFAATWDARANNEHARRICPLKNCHARQTKALSVLCIGMRVSVLSDRGDKVDFLISTSFTGMFGVNGMEKLSRTSVLGFLLLSCAFSSTSQEPQALPSADERYKVDILLIVAHPDDEGAATPYLARALDEHKRVGVVFGTRGSSGANEAGAEQAAALGAIREIEARNALTTLGITNVWFLGGKDTASQNVLLSLANWDHGESLEQLVR